ncbi:DUF4097 domain-containing protein [Paenibacillus sp. J5C_2022]|uniref:DUF4097 family beta strand repeat-containing protein n=1 Tax=Paenibacillus sp. J5C2022 TaxID=2977129 RepID=UPI0021CE1B41|nr:DUF4097 domain-containing protein [Paenibacillus sp. J5C2022]MCU6711700.1 DUF4097 domain-containing protein [Paenibacillus sp. J5C2022]
MKRSLGIILVIIGIIGLTYVIGTGGKSPVEGLVSFMTDEVNQEYAFDMNQIENLNIESRSINVKIEKGSGTSQAIVKLEGVATPSIAKSLKLDSKQSGNMLQLEASLEDGWKIIQIVNVSMTIELPEKQWNALDVKVGSSNINVNDVATGRIQTYAGSGNVSIIGATADNLDAKTGSGNIKAESVTGSHMTLKAGSGNIKLNRAEGKHIEAITSSGNISIEEYLADTMNIRAISGGIDLSDGFAELTAKATSGNIKLDAEQLRYDTKLEASSGNITVELEQDPESLSVDYMGGSGVGKVKKNGFTVSEMTTDKDAIKGMFGDGKVLLYARTSSGNFTLK